MGVSKPVENVILYLNTEVNCSRTSNLARFYEFSWQISPIILNEFSVCKVISIAHDAANASDHGDNIITIRLKDVLYNQELYRSADNSGYPILHAMPFDTEAQYYDASLGGLYLVPQTINKLSMIISDSVTVPQNGISENIKFVIGLVFQQYDRRFSLTEN